MKRICSYKIIFMSLIMWAATLACEIRPPLRQHNNVLTTIELTSQERSVADFNPADFFEPGEEQRFRFQIMSAVFDSITGKTWIAGALYKDAIIYRSLLLSVDNQQKWREETPAAAQTAIVYVALMPEVVAVESIYSAGSQLQNFWVFDSQKNKWLAQLEREAKGKDVFKQAVGCCVETVEELSVQGKVWQMTLSGTETSKVFISKNKGKDWRATALRPSAQKTLKDWSATLNDFGDDPSAQMMELRLKKTTQTIFVPRYWRINVTGSSSQLQPVYAL